MYPHNEIRTGKTAHGNQFEWKRKYRATRVTPNAWYGPRREGVKTASPRLSRAKKPCKEAAAAADIVRFVKAVSDF